MSARLTKEELADIREHCAEARMSCTCYWHLRTHEERSKLLGELEATIVERDKLAAALKVAEAERDEAREIARDSHGHHVASAVGMGLSPCSDCDKIDGWLSEDELQPVGEEKKP